MRKRLPRVLATFASAFVLQGNFELRLVHGGATLDTALPRLIVQLSEGSPSRALMRAQPAAPPRWQVVDRRGARLDGLAVLSPLLVDDPGGDLTGKRFGLATSKKAVLDMRVLAFSLGQNVELPLVG